MSSPTDFDLQDYEILADAMRDYLGTLEFVVEMQIEGWPEVESMLPAARATKRKVMRRMGRKAKVLVSPSPEPPITTQFDEFVQGTYFRIELDKLNTVCTILKYAENLDPGYVQKLLLDYDRRTFDDHHQTFLYESSAEDIADWLEFVYSVNGGKV